jgi:hypothetical protein
VKNAIIHPNTKRPGFAVARYADSKIGEAGYSVYRSVSRRYTAEKALLLFFGESSNRSGNGQLRVIRCFFDGNLVHR